MTDLIHQQIEAAAKVLAEGMDYPWEPMPEQGRKSMRALRQGGGMTERDLLPCISIRQPYAWLIVNGIKPVENRSWPTRFRGRILIHASANYPKRDYEDDREDYHGRWGIAYPDRDEMIGGIVGSATVIDCVTSHPSEWWIGPYGFVLDKPRAFGKLIPYKGALSIFNVPAAIVRAAASATGEG